jgi:hypothetical protein
MVIVGVFHCLDGVEHPAALRRGTFTIAAYAALDLAILGVAHVDRVHARHSADTIIAALEQYDADQGRYPQRLEELTPRYLTSIPSARHLPRGEFHYHSAVDEASLFYVTVEPVGHAFYNTRDKTWSYRF